MERRQFLKLSAVVLGSALFVEQKKAKSEELVKSIPVEVLRDGDKISLRKHKLDIALSDRNLIDQISSINSDWRNFEKWENKSPLVMEGYGTAFGYSSLAIGQFIVQTDDIRFQIARGDIGQLDNRLNLLLQMRDVYDRRKISELLNDDQKIIDAFDNLLGYFGFDGIVALKSPYDFGRTGSISIWDESSEVWSPKKKFIVLNTASMQTFSKWKGINRNFGNKEIQNTQVEMPWVAEVSTEFFEKLGLRNASSFYRIEIDETNVGMDLIYQEYKNKNFDVSQNFINFAAFLRYKLSNVSDQNLTYYLSNAIDSVQKGREISTLLSNILDIKIMDPNDEVKLDDALYGGSEEVIPAIPHGNLELAKLCLVLGNNNLLNKSIISYNQSCDFSGLPKLSIGILEDTSNGEDNFIVSKVGLVYKFKNNVYFLFFENSTPTEVQIKNIKISNQSQRLNIYY